MRSRRRAGLGAAGPGLAGRQQAAAQRTRRPHLEQASVTSASLTSAEQARLRALAAAARSAAPPGAARGSYRAAPGVRAPSGATRPDGSTAPEPAGPAPLRRSTGLALTAVGAILWLGVRVHLSFVELQTAGFILFVAGLVWLVVPVRGKRTLVRRHFDAAMTYLSWQPATPAEAHASLDELLGPPGGPQGGSDSKV